MHDKKEDKEIIIPIECNSVFDAVTEAARRIENPYETVLVEAYPVND